MPCTFSVQVHIHLCRSGQLRLVDAARARTALFKGLMNGGKACQLSLHLVWFCWQAALQGCNALEKRSKTVVDFATMHVGQSAHHRLRALCGSATLRPGPMLLQLF